MYHANLKCRWVGVLLVLAVCSSNSLYANINLEYRPGSQTVAVGQTVGIGLYAVSDDASVQTLSAVDLVFGWDPGFLDLLGLDPTGAAPLLSSAFPGADPFGLNESVPPQDGDGLYLALANLGSPVGATPGGTLLTTFQFQTLGVTAGTVVEMLVSGGSPARATTVFDGNVPNLDVTGTLGSASVAVIPGPASAVLALIGIGVARRRHLAVRRA